MLNLVVNRDKIKETYLSANDTEFKIVFNSSDWYKMYKKAIFLVGDDSYIVEGLENNTTYPLPKACVNVEFSVYIVGESSNSYKSTEKQLIRMLGGEVSSLEVQAAVEKYLERNPVSGMTEEQRIQLAKIPELENIIKDLEKQTGVGIQSISKSATNGLIDTYTIEFTDGTTTTFQIANGEKGDRGEQGKDGTTYTPQIGKITTISSAENASASVLIDEENKTANFNFSIPKGEKGDKGDSGIVTSVVIPNSAASHNAIFRGKNLTNTYSVDEICSRISNGSFEDLYIGDYFDITINAEGSEVVRCILAGFDMYWNNGDTPSFTNHHAVIVTKNCLNTTHAMNPTNTTVGGFTGSDMWTNVIPMYNTAFGSVLDSHLLSHRTLLTKTMNAELASNAGVGLKGASSDWEWVDTKLSLLSEIQVYGSNVFSSSFYDTGCDNLQLPLFVLDPTAKVCGKGGTGDGGRQWYWLRNVASASSFASVSYGGISNSSAASDGAGVRPLFCIG